jgi:hypothetical protein
MANFSQTIISTGLGTTTITVPSAGPYRMDGKIQLPTLIGGGGVSACLCTINQNGSPIYTGTAGQEGFGPLDVTCAANDALTFVLTSAAAADQPVNVIKMTVALSSGV